MIWVTDFGLAKIESDSDLTRTGDIVGTIRYLAPERFAGRCDARADVYALGLTLYELLARRPAFEAEDRHSLIRQVTQDEPRRLRQVDPTIPRDLETIVQTAIAKDPEDRYATAAALRDELERFLADRPIRSRPVSPFERYWRWCKRNPLLALASSVACALIIVVAIVSSVAAFRNGRLADQLKAQRDEANRNLIQAYTNEAEARRQSRRAGQRFEALDAIGRAMRLPGSAGLSEPERLQLRNQAIGAMGLPDMRVVWQVELADPFMRAFAVDASFERYALKRDDGTVVIRRLADHRELLALPDAPCANRSHPISEFSPDGRYLAVKFCTDRDMLHVWDLQSRRLILAETNFAGCLVATWAFHPDGRRLAFGRTDGSIVIFDLKGRLELSRWPSSFGSATCMAFNADGSQLAFVSAFSGSIHVLSTDSGRVVAQLDNPATVFHLAWNPRSPDCLAAGLEDNTIRIWDIGTRRQTGALEGDSYNGLVVAFHPDGALLVSRGWSGMIRFWDIRTRQQILSMPSHWLPELRFARDGSRLSGHSASGRTGILEVSYETECRSLFRQPGPLSSDTTALAIDRNGRFVANSCATGITVWDLPTGSPLALLPVSGEVKCVQFDPAGSILTSYPMTLRWPISLLPDGPVIGPPQLLQWYQTRDGFMNSRDGCVVAMANYDGGGLIFDADHPDRSRRILPHNDVRGIALSPDGRWLVTCSFRDGTLKVWDTRAGLVRPDIPAHLGVSATVFSPDGRWLALCKGDQGWELIETRTWTSRIRLGNRQGPAAFSPDSAIFAHETHFKSYDGSIALVELATGRELARINDPDGARSYRIEFSPDGTQLIGVLSDQPYVRIWDLRSVRQRLAELDLDWSPPPAWGSAAKPTKASGRPSPPTFRVDRGLLDHWIKLAPIKRREQAIADAEAFLRQEPDQKDVRNWLALCSNALAWELVARSNSDRDPLRALPLARRAVALEPDRDMFRKTLGLALYRSGRPAEAITVLERSLAAKNFASVPYDLFLLALCHAKQNEAAQARVYFNRALLWLKSNSKPLPPADEELSALRAEAEVLLRSSHAELPEDVFAKVPAPG
jgi:WD40 repeat protein